MTACRSCGAPVTWALTENKKWMPVDAEPAADGNVLLTAGNPPLAKVLTSFGKGLLGNGERLYRSHFSTCPNARSHRKAAA